MKMRTSSQQSNPILKRREIIFIVEHPEKEGTPSRFEVRKKLAELLNEDLDVVYIKKLETKTGTKTTVGESNVYESVEQAQRVEPKHIITRNEPIEKPKE
jgi:ribosomal protein S24E